jgi:hypothetical protein
MSTAPSGREVEPSGHPPGNDDRNPHDERERSVEHADREAGDDGEARHEHGVRESYGNAETARQHQRKQREHGGQHGERCGPRAVFLGQRSHRRLGDLHPDVAALLRDRRTGVRRQQKGHERPGEYADEHSGDMQHPRARHSRGVIGRCDVQFVPILLGEGLGRTEPLERLLDTPAALERVDDMGPHVVEHGRLRLGRGIGEGPLEGAQVVVRLARHRLCVHGSSFSTRSTWVAIPPHTSEKVASSARPRAVMA